MALQLNLNLKHFKELIQPSWLSLAIDTLLLVIVTATALAANLVHANPNDKFVANYLIHAAGNSYSDLSYKVSHYGILNDLPLFLFWILVGIACWYLVINLYKNFFGAIEVAEELNYTHVNRRALGIELLTKFAIRLVALICWYIFIRLLVFRYVPYYLYTFHNLVNSQARGNIFSLVISVIVLALLLHINTIFLRVVTLRLRVFGGIESD